MQRPGIATARHCFGHISVADIASLKNNGLFLETNFRGQTASGLNGEAERAFSSDFSWVIRAAE
jgi:hypothetical protein